MRTDAASGRVAGSSALPPLGIALMVTIALGWGQNWPAMKVALVEIPPWTFRLLCIAIAATALLLLTVRPTISGLYPPLLYFSQVYGALLKTWVLFRLDRQRWTRQNIAWASPLPPARRRLQTAASVGLHLLALAALTVGVALATGVLAVPSAATLRTLL